MPEPPAPEPACAPVAADVDMPRHAVI